MSLHSLHTPADSTNFHGHKAQQLGHLPQAISQPQLMDLLLSHSDWKLPLCGVQHSLVHFGQQFDHMLADQQEVPLGTH